jgi:hypothetical protein
VKPQLTWPKTIVSPLRRPWYNDSNVPASEQAAPNAQLSATDAACQVQSIQDTRSNVHQQELGQERALVSRLRSSSAAARLAVGTGEHVHQQQQEQQDAASVLGHIRRCHNAASHVVSATAVSASAQQLTAEMAALSEQVFRGRDSRTLQPKVSLGDQVTALGRPAGSSALSGTSAPLSSQYVLAMVGLFALFCSSTFGLYGLLCCAVTTAALAMKARQQGLRYLSKPASPAHNPSTSPCSVSLATLHCRVSGLSFLPGSLKKVTRSGFLVR